MMTLSYSTSAALAGIPKVAVGSKQPGFACTATYCYTSGWEYAPIFKMLQEFLNSVAKLNGIPTQLNPDGKIGAGTVQLAQKLAYLYMSKNQPGLSTLILTDGGTKEDISSNAPEIIAELRNIISKAATGPATVATTGIYPGVKVPAGTGPGGPLPSYSVLSVQAPNQLTPATPIVPPWGIQTTPGSPSMTVPSAGPHITIPTSSVPVTPAEVEFIPIVTAGPSKLNIGLMIAAVAAVGVTAVLLMDRKASRGMSKGMSGTFRGRRSRFSR